jgi:hypothetical protein
MQFARSKRYLRFVAPRGAVVNVNRGEKIIYI